MPLDNATGISWPRIILHADMDAFFAAVEERDHPALKGKPLVVGGLGKRSVVSTANYDARRFGIKSAMPMAEALRRCPELMVVPPNFDRYQEASAQINQVFHNYSPLVEPLSLDEAFIDMSGAEGLFGPPEEMARRIKQDVLAATGGLTVSVGASTTKYVAKVASDFQKPDGLTLVPPEQVRSFLWPLPVSRLWGAGAKTEKRLREMGFGTIEDVAKASRALLDGAFGSLGPQLYDLANGIDPREVIPERDAKSIGKEVTFEEDLSGKRALMPHFRSCADSVARRLRRDGVVARGIRVKLKTADFKLMTRQASVTPPTSNAGELLLAAEKLLSQLDLRLPLRLVGLAAFNLQGTEIPVQGELFPDPERARHQKLDRTIDAVLARFGDSAVKRGSDR